MKITGYNLVHQFSLPAETSVIFSYSASAKTVCNLLLSAESVVHDILLPVKSVHLILLPAEASFDGQSWQEMEIGGLVYCPVVCGRENIRISLSGIHDLMNKF